MLQWQSRAFEATCLSTWAISGSTQISGLDASKLDRPLLCMCTELRSISNIHEPQAQIGVRSQSLYSITLTELPFF